LVLEFVLQLRPVILVTELVPMVELRVFAVGQPILAAAAASAFHPDMK
jgi:hypothetical protein